MKGLLFLSGGGNEKQSKEFDAAFVQSIVATSPRVLYIPIALHRTTVGFEASYDWITTMLSAVSDHFIDVTMWLDIGSKTAEDLRKFDAIYIGGGNTYKLLSIFKEHSFDRLLISYLNEGGVVYGGSAGAIIFGKTIRTVAEENDDAYSFEEGIGLLGRFSLRCHYTASEKAKISALAVRESLDILALPEGTGLILKDHVLTAVGGGITRFEASAGQEGEMREDETIIISP